MTSDTMTIEEFLSTLRKREILLSTREDNLVVDAPAGTVDDELRDQILGRKSEILAFLKTAEGAHEGRISATSDGQDPTLSFAQERMWFLDQLQSTGAFNAPVEVRFTGPLNVEAFGRSVDEVVRRHEVLRTVFPLVEGKPIPSITPAESGYLEFADFSNRNDSEKRRCIDEKRAENASVPFDLAGGPLVRTTLLQCEREGFLLLLTTHHIVSDGWSVGIFFQELARLYEAFSGGRPSPLPDLEIQYSDYARWQRNEVSDEKMDRDLDYWRQTLSGAPPQLVLPADKVRPSVYRFEGGKVAFEIGLDLTAKLRALSDKENATLFMALISAYTALLARISDVRDVVVGYPIAGRRRKELEQLIGCFVNTLILRSDLSNDPSFMELLRQVSKSTAEAYEHQDLPFEKLVEEMQPDRDLSHNPLFQVAFLFQNVPLTAPEISGMEVLPRAEDRFTPGATFDMTLVMEETPENGLRGELEYNRTLFEPETMERFVQLYQALMREVTNSPDESILELEILEEADRNCLIYERNNTTADYPRFDPISRLFEQQVEATPHEVAVADGDDRATYEELNRRSNRLARLLKSQGIGQDSIVAVMLDRSVELVVTLLGIMKAGATYLPIDMAYPDSRVGFMLEDSQVSLLVTRPETIDDRDELAGYREKVLSIADALLADNDESDLNEDVKHSDAAYVIYTSGSTGKPKGVVIEHGGLTNYIWWAKKQYLQDERLDFPLYTSLAFDLTVTSLFVPLISGGRIQVYTDASDSRVPTILEVVQDGLVDIVKLTPAHLALIKDLDLRNSRIKKLVVGGENLKTDLARRIHDAFGGNVEIYNEYGPTETVVGCMIHRYDPQTDLGASVPIGLPADNARIYLLDEKLNPVLPGAIGEMYVSGDGVARGYLNREELTRERFVSDPFVSGARMYRTGDTARWRNQGVMEYCGRIDHQVKIRGHRVELGEIESELEAHDSVRECIVDVVQKHSAAPVDDLELEHCSVCGLPSNYPGTTFDDRGRCNQCTAYENYRKNVEPYFKQIDELGLLFTEVRNKRRGDYDCIALLSGGKDSTYVLAQLVDMGLEVLAYTLDNGYISDQAKENIRRVVEALGVDHVFGTTPHMNAIFADSLARHSNVCNGCFKTLYTLSIQLAREKGIPCIVTGLSRGQQFETRLSNFYRSDDFSPDTVDRFIKEARKVYHRVNDEVSRCLDVSVFEEDDIFEQVQIIDFYRYSDVSLKDLYNYLDEKLPWVRPSDTGRSTNCLINDVGIYIHKKDRRYHNYAMPYAWDVRTGHKERDAALEELDDHIDVPTVRRIMTEIGYADRAEQQSEQVLTAYFTSGEPIETDKLRDHLSTRLPDALIPPRFIRLDEIPLTPNGKIDRQTLARMSEQNPDELPYVPPSTPTEQRLVSIWSHALGLDRVSIRDNFFRLGGHSLLAAQVVSSIAQDMQVELPVGVLFDHVTIEALARVVTERQEEQSADHSGLEAILLEVESLTDEEVEGELLRPETEQTNN